jgi:energy-coupling factor transporter ATP-binding protein EcfA2
MTPELHDRIIARLLDSGAVDSPWSDLIVAALDGEERLRALLDGEHPVAKPAPPPVPTGPKSVEPPGAYVSSITVEGFRGVGPAVTLPLRPGPGLTLIVGRNGSGKSSFAEALEFLLTGANYRWDDRPKVWVQGWRNLHHAERAVIKAELLVEQKGTLTVSREWKAGEDLPTAVAVTRTKGGAAEPLHSLGWEDPLAKFRPFLSYNELGSLLDEGPSRLYDALSSVLGLEDLLGIQNLLAGVRKERQTQIDEAKRRAAELRDRIARLDHAAVDRRLAQASLLLEGPPWDLESIRRLVEDAGEDDSSDIEILKKIAALSLSDENAVGAAAARLRGTQRALDEMSGTDVQRASDLADLLEEAIEFHTRHKANDCPVCSKGQLNSEWVEKTHAEVLRLKELAGRLPGRSARTRRGDGSCKAAGDVAAARFSRSGRSRVSQPAGSAPAVARLGGRRRAGRRAGSGGSPRRTCWLVRGSRPSPRRRGQRGTEKARGHLASDRDRYRRLAATGPPGHAKP